MAIILLDTDGSFMHIAGAVVIILYLLETRLQGVR